MYDYIDTLDPSYVGFEVLNKDEEIKYELVTPPPQIKALINRDKTLEEEGITRSSLFNIKQLN